MLLSYMVVWGPTMNHKRAAAVSLVAALALGGCGVSDATLGEAEVAALDDAALGSSSQSYVVYRRDQRRCPSPLCGGYFVHDVNRVTLREEYVSGLDLGATGLSEEARAAVEAAGDGEVVLRGKLGPVEPQFRTRAFVASEAWQGLPGVTVAEGATFYRVAAASIQCVVAPCPSMRARKLNSTATALLTQVDVADAARWHVQESWLASRLSSRDGIAAGVVETRPSTVGPAQESVLDASQVFVRLPERHGPCPQLPQVQCTGGKVGSLSRTPDRCLVQTACVTPGICPPVVVSCDAGYHAVMWRGGTSGCLQWACDPDALP